MDEPRHHVIVTVTNENGDVLSRHRVTASDVHPNLDEDDLHVLVEDSLPSERSVDVEQLFRASA